MRGSKTDFQIHAGNILSGLGQQLFQLHPHQETKNLQVGL
jgi:hypothetical protein